MCLCYYCAVKQSSGFSCKNVQLMGPFKTASAQKKSKGVKAIPLHDDILFAPQKLMWFPSE